MTVPAEPGQVPGGSYTPPSPTVSPPAVSSTPANTGIYGEPKPVITQEFGKTDYSYHYASGLHSGVDVSVPINNVVTSPLNLKIVGVYYSDQPKGYQPNGYGNYIVAVDPSTGYKLIFGHLNSVNVQQGQTISTGYPIGREGSTGNSSGPHLHFEVNSPSNSPVDPEKFLSHYGASVYNLFGFFDKNVAVQNDNVPFPDTSGTPSNISGIMPNSPPPSWGNIIPPTTNPPPTDTGLTQSQYYTLTPEQRALFSGVSGSYSASKNEWFNFMGISVSNPFLDMWDRFKAWWDGVEKMNVTFVIIGVVLLLLGISYMVVSNSAAGKVAKSLGVV